MSPLERRKAPVPGRLPQTDPGKDSIRDECNRATGYGAARATDPDTSLAAALADANTRRLRRGLVLLVVAEVHAAGARGTTVDEMHRRMPGTDRGTLARRFTDARQAGLIVDSGQRRPTRRGCAAIVWVAAERPHGSPAERVAPVGAER